MIKATLFDLDGVLVDTGEVHYAALNLALCENSCGMIEPQQHRELYNGLPTAVKLQMLVDRGLVPPEKLADIITRKKYHTTNLLKTHVKFDPEVYCLLAGLKSREVYVGVVSNAIRDTVVSVCRSLEIARFLDTVVSNEDGPPKPAPDLYRLACRQLGVSSPYCLAVEDGKYGVESARSAGCKVLVVNGPRDVTPTNVWRELCSRS